MLRIFGLSIVITVLSLVVAFVYGGPTALALCAILGILEVSLSFDNAVINATVLQRMSEFWQKIFLTIGVLIAVFGMRLVFPLAIVWITAGLNPKEALDLALNVPTDGSPTYESLLTAAHPQIASFGGAFLLMLFLNFILEEREITWLGWLERPLAKLGKLDMLAVVLTLVTILLTAEYIADDAHRSTVLFAGVLGLVVYVVVDGLGSMFHTEELAEEAEEAAAKAGGPSELAKATGKAGFFLFLYLEVLDASFSFDGVIGAFAITSDPIIIALGLGLIGAMFVRSITVYLVRKGTLAEYVYLEHGAHWAIGALAAILFISIGVHVNELITGLIGIAFIGAAFVTSVMRNRREDGDEVDAVNDKEVTPVG
ncbi:DUF475 domain-containing protein [Nocardia sp. NPDC055321]